MREGRVISLICIFHVSLTSYELYALPLPSCLSQLLHASLRVYLTVRSYVINLESNMDCSSVIKAGDEFQGLQ